MTVKITLILLGGVKIKAIVLIIGTIDRKRVLVKHPYMLSILLISNWFINK